MNVRDIVEGILKTHDTTKVMGTFSEICCVFSCLVNMYSNHEGTSGINIPMMIVLMN